MAIVAPAAAQPIDQGLIDISKIFQTVGNIGQQIFNPPGTGNTGTNPALSTTQAPGTAPASRTPLIQIGTTVALDAQTKTYLVMGGVLLAAIALGLFLKR